MTDKNDMENIFKVIFFTNRIRRFWERIIQGEISSTSASHTCKLNLEDTGRVKVKPGIELRMPSHQINTWSQSSLLPVSCLAVCDQEPSLDPCPGLSPVVVSKPSTEVKARSEGIIPRDWCHWDGVGDTCVVMVDVTKGSQKTKDWQLEVK
ncbi:hypothetical protein BTVI_15519 [Pitangus sulphuratus]|nr:hypothetical protein BTVI_15519 [Pitangus sulphuratus]